MLRAAIEEPSQRAASAAVVSIFAFCDVPLAIAAVHWWLARHPAPAQPIAIAHTPWWNILPIVLLGAALAWVRLRREQRRRAADAQRRSAQTV